MEADDHSPREIEDDDITDSRTSMKDLRERASRGDQLTEWALATGKQMTGGFDTPEEAALASWLSTPAASPVVRSVETRGDRAEVILETNPSYQDWVYCVRVGDWWVVTVSGNGPTQSWDDPDVIDWDRT